MPALPAVPSVLRMVLEYSDGEDSRAINRFYLQYPGSAPTDALLDSFCNNVQGEWNVWLSPFLHSGLSLIGVTGEDLTSSTAAVGSNIATNAGSRSGTLLPAGAAAVIQQKVGRRYRGGHGRFYAPYGVAGDLTDPQTWTTGFTSGLTSAFASFQGAIAGAGWTGSGTLAQVIVSYFFGFTNVLYPSGRYHAVPTRRTTPLIQLVTTYGVNPKVGSQRRRNLQSA